MQVISLIRWCVRLLISVVVVLVISVPAAAAQDACEALLSATEFSELPDAPTSLSVATIVEAADGLPAHCRIEGRIVPQVKFELRLPVGTWNRKFLMQGCGGLCGRVNGATCDDALVRNYAVVVTDLGHDAPPYEASWAQDNLAAEIDFAYRATHVVAVSAKAIIGRFYKAPPERSYFRGCSTGGRQGLVEAQRFPDDFDGIIAGAPVLDETATAALHLIWSGQANLDASGEPILSPKRVAAVHDRIIDACDGADGFEDRIIEDPRQCDWEIELPECRGDRVTQRCFTGAEIEVLRKLYDGPWNSEGDRLLPGGLMPGSEYEWVPNFVGSDGPALFHPDGPIKQLYQNLIFFNDPGPGHSASEFDFDRDPARLALVETLYSAKNPDLRRFRGRGGKLIIYQGWDDIEVTPMNTLDYFETMQATMGGRAATREFARLFMLPGVAHCRRGSGADAIDWLTALERWVEFGEAPESVVAHHLVDAQSYAGLPRLRYPLVPTAYDWARPVYPYPGVARFGGKGRSSDPVNWPQHDPSAIAQ
jgi:hypothetical protein